jgi:hypothetical protein
VRQKLCRRLEGLEKINAAAEAAQRVTTGSVDMEAFRERITAAAEAWHAVPENQAWLAAQPPDFLYHRVQALRAQLAEMASGRSRSVHQGGY